MTISVAFEARHCKLESAALIALRGTFTRIKALGILKQSFANSVIMLGWMFKNRFFALVWVALICWRVVAFTSVASVAKGAADGVNSAREASSDNASDDNNPWSNSAEDRRHAVEKRFERALEEQEAEDRKRQEERDYERAAERANMEAARISAAQDN